MAKPKTDIFEISLTLIVDGKREELVMPVPYDYDGQELLQLVMADILPADPDDWPDEDELLDLPCEAPDYRCDDGTAETSGWMDARAFAEWKQRSKDLADIDTVSFELEEMGLLPGSEPGLYDLHTHEPSIDMLDETIEHDLRNATVTDNGGKAAFRAIREASGASQAALADALGVNVRTVKRWETTGQPEPPHDAWRLVEGWHADAMAGARWHVRRAEELRDGFHEAYVLVLYRSQDEFDRVLGPILAQAPSYHWQDAISEAKERALAEGGDGSYFEIDHPYTNFPGTRSYWRANAAARTAAVLMDAARIPYGFAYVDDTCDQEVWIPRADVQRIEAPGSAIITCGMR